MGSGLTGDGQALGLGPANQFHRFLCGNVADVIGAAGFLHQFQIPLDLPPFAFGADAGVTVFPGPLAVVDAAAAEQLVDLTVGHDVFPQFFGLHHGGLHHVIGLNAPAVVREARHMGGHIGKVRQCLTLLALGNGAVGVDVDDGIPVDNSKLFL